METEDGPARGPGRGHGDDRMSGRGSQREAEEAGPDPAGRNAGEPAAADLDLDYHDHDDDDHHDEEHHGAGSLAGTVLWAVLGALTVMALTVWAAPKIAPHVPAPIGRVLAPMSAQFEAEIATLRDAAEARETRLASELAALEARLDQRPAPDPAPIDALEARLADRLERVSIATETADTAADAARAEARAALAAAEQAQLQARTATDQAEAARSLGEKTADRAAALTGDLAAARRDLEAAVARANDLARRLGAVDAEMAGLTREVAALGSALSEMPEPDAAEGPAPRELAAAIGALQARLDGLRSELDARPDAVSAEDAAALADQASAAAVQELEPRIAEARAALEARLAGDLEAQRTLIAADIARLEARIRAAEELGRMTRAEALDEAEAALARAALRGARDALAVRVAAGEPYAANLAEVERLSGRTAEPPLVRHAAGGLAPAAALSDRFPALARRALEAEARAGAADGAPGDRVSSWLRAQVFTRPTAEQEGDDLPARLSRIEARLGEGALATALAEAEALPPRAAEVFAGWTADLRERVEAEAALARFVAETAAAAD